MSFARGRLVDSDPSSHPQPRYLAAAVFQRNYRRSTQLDITNATRLNWSLRLAASYRAGQRTPDAAGKGLEVLNNRCEMKFIAHTRQAPKPHALEAVMGLQVREAHLDLLAFVARLLELRRVDKCASHITGILVDVPAQPSERHVRCALGLQRAGSTIARDGDVHNRPISMNLAGSRQQFARRAGVDIALPIEREVVT